jgi:hypothetical protein
MAAGSNSTVHRTPSRRELELPDRLYVRGYQFTLTDDPYYVTTEHSGDQVRVFSTSIRRPAAYGTLQQKIANRPGKIVLRKKYNMKKWKHIGEFYFIAQTVRA